MANWLDVSATDPHIAYTANGSQTVFTVPFLFFANSDLKVYLNGVLRAITTHYTVAGALNESGGTVTFLVAPANGVTVLIVRDLPLALTTHVPPSGPLDIPSLNFQFSRLVAMVQQVEDVFGVASALGNNSAVASGVVNDSSVPGASVKDALNAVAPILSVIFAASYGVSAANSAAANATALSALATAIGSGGKRVVFPNGTILTDTPWNMTARDNLIIEGQGASDPDFDTAGTVLVYTGSGSATAFDFANCKGLSFRDIAFAYNSATYTGILMSTACTASVWNNNSIERCAFYQIGTTYTATALLYIRNVVNLTVSCTRFARAAIGVLGAFNNETSANTALIKFLGCDFTFCETASIFNPGFRWSCIGCGFEPKSTGAPSPIISSGSITVSGAADNGSGLIRLTVTSTSGWSTGQNVSVWNVGGVPNANGIWTITVVDATHLDLQGSTFAGAYTSGGLVGNFVESLTLSGNAFADATAAGTWIDFQTVHALSITSNSFGGNGSQVGIAMAGAGAFGVHISGNLFSSLATGVNFIVSSTGVGVEFNDFLNVATPIAGKTNCDFGSSFSGNNPPSANNVLNAIYTISAAGVNMNAVADTTLNIALPNGLTRYRIQALMIHHASADLVAATTVQYGLFTAAGGGGTAVVAATNSTVSSTAESTNNNAQFIGPSITASLSTTQLFFRVTIAHGSAATADVTLQIQPLL
jgi:hypothetical protein